MTTTAIHVICNCGEQFHAHTGDVDAKHEKWRREHRCSPRERENRTYWLSFSDPKRKKGQQFLGVAIVDVTDEEAQEALMFNPMAAADPFIAAAVMKAHATGCNPGGEVGSKEIPQEFCTDPRMVNTPRNKLLQRDELIALGHIAG